MSIKCERLCTLWGILPKEKRVDKVAQKGAGLSGDREWTCRSMSGQTVAYRKCGCRCPVLAVRLIEDVGEVMNHGFLADEQFLRNLAVSLASGNELEYIGLALGQVGWKRRWLLWAT